ncbi:MAG: NUDIX domain-containing protein, partial [Sulfuricella sp.]|nr:NUDIX domain-containing protein [Sulfuricella sp.]
AHWSGLGYYARGRNLHRAAQLVVAQHGGVFPSDSERVVALPGIGRSTAAAILAFAFGHRHAILDGNVKRVLARCFGIAGYPGAKAVENRLWQQAEALLPESGIETYTQALMDLGATVCTRKPSCAACPLVSGCVAWNEKRVAELPESKPRKPLPQKEAAMLILLRQGEVYLEKRPPAGIWGGLWSFPEIGAGEEALAACRERFGIEGKLLPPLPEFIHTFTHFRLKVQPCPIEVKAWRPEARQDGGLWLPLEEAVGAAVPTPVRRLLGKFSR